MPEPEFASDNISADVRAARSRAGDAIPADEWLRRFMARIHGVAGFNVNPAATWPQGYAGLSARFESDPEGAADAELKYWLD